MQHNIDKDMIMQRSFIEKDASKQPLLKAMMSNDRLEEGTPNNNNGDK
jgi:hypothetical protein